MADTSPEPAPEAEVARQFVVARGSPDPFTAETSLLVELRKAVRPASTNTGTITGARSHLIHKGNSRRLRELNPTHSICIDAKRASSMGMGHRDQAIHDTLDPLCRFSWQDVMNAAGEDDCGEGEGFIEVVWDEGRTRVLALNHLDGEHVHVVVEQQNNSEQIHYQVTSDAATRETVAMAAWGDLLELKRRYAPGAGATEGGSVRNDLVGTRDGVLAAPLGGRIVNSEVIHFRTPTARDPYCGYPDWVAATPAIELVQMMIRHEFDFHFNRGVPELIFTIIGGGLKEEDWDEIKAIFKANQGLGNSRKTMALHIPGSPDKVKVQVDKLAMESSQDDLSERLDPLSMLIATAHGVPPLLANILLPGKIGAANEGPNALLLFQKRKLGQIQKSWSRTLAQTLGSGVEFNQPDGTTKTLTAEQFLGSKYQKSEVDPMTGQPGTPKDESGMPIYVEKGNGFQTVLDGMTLGAQQTMARMKEPIAGSGRSPEDGLLGGADDRKPSDPKKSR